MESFANSGHVLIIWLGLLNFILLLNYKFPHFMKHAGGFVGLTFNSPYFKGTCGCTKEKIDKRKKRYKAALTIFLPVSLLIFAIYITCVITTKFQ